jgi:hypothetical protein
MVWVTLTPFKTPRLLLARGVVWQNDVTAGGGVLSVSTALLHFENVADG